MHNACVCGLWKKEEEAVKSKPPTRRHFLATAAAGAAYSLMPGAALGANNRVNLGLIGVGWRGGQHLKAFGALKDVNIIAVSDADSTRMDQAGDGVVKHQDFRRLLDMPEIDAVVVAAPNHWHCLATILACEAGKHVYTEKPVSHHIFEGRQMVNAARKYKRIVQAGTQQRSCPAVQNCAADIQAGKYGKVLWTHTSKLGSREPIGKVKAPMTIDPSIDYDLWAGPAPMGPVMRTQFHYDWHWQWNWGDGEMGNWAVHYVDDLRHLLGWDDVPGNVIAAGNRWWDDDGQTPNMHMALMEHRGVKCVIDIRNMRDYVRKNDKGGVYRGRRGGNFIMCENGYVAIKRGGGAAYDLHDNVIKEYKGDSGKDHQSNFVEAIRQDSNASLACEIEVGHQSTTMCHLANISYRVGHAASPEAAREAFKGHEDAVDTIEGIMAQIGPAVDFKKQPITVGPKLHYDKKTERFSGGHAKAANELVKLPGRGQFVVPDTI